MNRILVLIAALSLGIQGCSSTQVYGASEKAVQPSIQNRLLGRIEYSGNAEYLPRMLAADSDSGSKAVYRYSYTVSYEAPGEHPLTVFNPLLIVGMPKGTDAVVVAGVLEIVKDGTLLKRYEKSVVLKKDKTVFSEGETLTEMRKKGLLLVRDQIDLQLVEDQQILAKQLNTERK